MLKRGFLGTFVGVLTAAAISLSVKPVDTASKPLTETYFRKGFVVEGEDFVFSYVKAWGSKDGDCTLRLEDRLQIEDRGCDEKVETVYLDHMRAIRVRDTEKDKEMEKSLAKAFLVMEKYRKKIYFEKVKKRWEMKRPTTLIEELPSYLAFLRSDFTHKFWMYGFDVESSLGTSSEGDEKREVFHHDIIGKFECELSPVGLPEAPGIYLLDYDCDDNVDYVRDSVEIKGLRSLPAEDQKIVDKFYNDYKNKMNLKESYKAWEKFKKDISKEMLDIFDGHH